MLLPLRFLLTLSLACLAAGPEVRAQDGAGGGDSTTHRPPRVAVLDFGDTETGRRAAADVAAHLSKYSGLRLVDSAQARSAARGLGYLGSLNLTLEEARDLGAAIDCDYYLTGDAQTLRRSSSAAPVYHEAYASVFIVSARDGRLVAWDRPRAEAPTPEEAERLLAAELARRADSFRVGIVRAEEDEQARRRRVSSSSPADDPPYFEDAPEEGSDAAKGFVPPHPYRRVRPPYPDTASQAEAEATVDAAVEIDERGEVAGVRVVRWGGFGLDHAVVETLRGMHFRPATRSGRAVPVRVLMRYNFRRPPRSGQPQQAGEGEMKLGPAFKALLNRQP